jgi:hypothetical protein
MHIEVKQKFPNIIAVRTLYDSLLYCICESPQGSFRPPQFGLNVRHRQIEYSLGIPRQLIADHSAHDEIANNDHRREDEQCKNHLPVKRTLWHHFFQIHLSPVLS